MPDLPARRLGNRPGLTGLRAVAITVVVARHTGEVWPGGFDGSAFGFAGVDIFFVLSGFLITSLLVGEWWRTGSISLGQFYIRRALRLLPALFAFLLVVLILTPFEPDVSHRVLAQTVGLSAVFLGNIAKTLHMQFPLPHLWSLGMEEQFYLLWPALLLVLLRLRVSRTAILGVVIGGAARAPDRLRAGPGLRVAPGASARFSTAAPRGRGGLRRGGVRRRRRAGRAVRGLGNDVGPDRDRAGGRGLRLCRDRRASGAAARFLTWGPVIYLGEISYALYLWHFPVLYLWPTNHLSVPGRVAISVGLAAISFEFVEKPFLRKKPQHTPDQTERDAVLGPMLAPRPAEARGAGG
jgi:peptidoglycan/LPS O-acetylase OafA/YrhL